MAFPQRFTRQQRKEQKKQMSKALNNMLLAAEKGIVTHPDGRTEIKIGVLDYNNNRYFLFREDGLNQFMRQGGQIVASQGQQEFMQVRQQVLQQFMQFGIDGESDEFLIADAFSLSNDERNMNKAEVEAEFKDVTVQMKSFLELIQIRQKIGEKSKFYEPINVYFQDLVDIHLDDEHLDTENPESHKKFAKARRKKFQEFDQFVVENPDLKKLLVGVNS